MQNGLFLSLTLLMVAVSQMPSASAAELRQLDLPGLPTTDYRSIVRDLDRATGAAVKYYDGTTTLVTDPEWLGLLKRLLVSVDGTPDQICLCINYPQVTFLNKDGPIANMEVPHGRKLRFSGAHYSGDFIIDAKCAHLIIELLMSQHDRGFKFHSPPRS